MNPILTTCQILVILALGVLGGFVLIKRSKHHAGQVFALLCFLTAAWISSEIVTDIFEARASLKPALTSRNVAKMINVFLAATFVCFAWYFPRKLPSIRPIHLLLTYLIPLGYAIALFTKTEWDAITAEIIDGILVLKYGPLHLFYIAYVCACGLYAVGFLLYRYHHSVSPIVRVQIQYVTTGIGLPYLSAVIFSLILPRLGLRSYYFIGTLAPAIAVFFIAYAIIKYRAMEIETVMNRSLIWLLMSSLILLPIYVVIHFIGGWIRGLSNWQLALFVTALFFPFFLYTRKVQPLIDRLFQRDYYAMRRAIDRLIVEARGLKELPALARHVIETAQKVLRVPHATLLVYREAQQGYVLIDTDSTQQTQLTPAHQFLRWLAGYDAILEQAQVELQPQYAGIRGMAGEYFQEMEAEVCVPFVHEGRLIGALNIGRRAGKRRSFTAVEIELLTRLRAAVTLALDNSLLHEAQLHLQERHVQTELIATASGALAHSIKNPLGLLDANLDLLRDATASLENDDAHFAISEIETQIRRIGGIVNQIRTADIGEPDIVPCHLNLVLSDALAEVKRTYPQASVNVNKPVSDLPEILGDASQLRLAFCNLITNAYQAMQPSGGVLTIHAETVKSQSTPSIRIQIRDTGCGMPDDFIQQILTRPFTTRRQGGTGLGVWTTKKIIEAHGGTLELTSQVGDGTTATVILPISMSDNRLHR